MPNLVPSALLLGFNYWSLRQTGAGPIRKAIMTTLAWGKRSRDWRTGVARKSVSQMKST